jgi:hypothetical protein
VSRYLPGADAAASEPLPRPDAPLVERYGFEEAPPRAPDLPVRWALPVCAEHLRRRASALRRLGVEVRAKALARVARSWLDPVDALRREGLQRVPVEAGLSEASLAWGLDRAFEVITEDALLAWGPRPELPVTLSGHVWAGNVVTAGLPPVFASLLVGAPALVKAPGELPAFAELFARSVAVHAPELGDCLGAAGWSRNDQAATDALLGCVDVLFAFGGDAAIDSLRARSAVPVAGFGHRISAGLVADDADDAALRGLWVDALAWDGGGCLSPALAFVDGDAEAVARRLAALAPAVAEQLPAVPGDLAGGAERAALLGLAGMTGFAASGPGWAVVALPDSSAIPTIPPRTLVLLPASPADAAARLAELGPVLQGVAVAGAPSVDRTPFEALGASVFAPAGRLQTPPVDWDHDGVSILKALHAG